MADNETSVLYKALADFSALHRATLQAKKDLAELKAAQDQVNASDLANQSKIQSAYDKTANASKNKVKFVDAEAASAKNAANATKNVASELSNEAVASEKAATGAKNHADAETKRASTLSRVLGILRDSSNQVDGLSKKYTNSTPILNRYRNALDEVFKSHKKLNDEQSKSPGILFRAESEWGRFDSTLVRSIRGVDSAGKSLDVLGKKSDKAGKGMNLAFGRTGAIVALVAALITIINPLIAGISALGIAAYALAGNIASLSGNITVLGPGLFALISVFAGVKVAVNGVSQAFKDVDNAQKFADDLKKLSPAAQDFVKQLVSMRKEYTDSRKAVQESFFSQFVGDLGTLKTLMPIITQYLQVGASAAGKFIDNFLNTASSGPWTSDFGSLIKTNGVILGHFSDGLMSIFDIFRNLSVAAAPFAELLAGKMANGLKVLQQTVQVARDDGSLTAWLDKSNTRLLIWWEIIKNIGATLFNYGKATSAFGEWLQEGFLNITAGWRKASENATKAGSPFQKYLENIKPVLGELKGILGGFFHWLKTESESPDNLKTMTELLHTIRTDLGPSLGKILDAINKSGIGDSLLKSLASIADAVADILKKGGADGLKSFIGTFETLFDIIDKIVSIPGVGSTLGQIAAALGAIAAIKFIADFTKITSLVKLLTGGAGLGKAATDAASIKSSFGAMDAMQFGGLLKLLPLITTLATLQDKGAQTVNATDAKQAEKDAKDGANPVTGGIPNNYVFKSRSEAEKFANSGAPHGLVIYKDKNGKQSILDAGSLPVVTEDNPKGKKAQDNLNKDKTAAGKDGNPYHSDNLIETAVKLFQRAFGLGPYAIPDKPGNTISGGKGFSVTPKKIDLPGGNTQGFKLPSPADILGTIGKTFGKIKFPSPTQIIGSIGKVFGKIKLPNFGSLFQGLFPKGGIKFPNFGSLFSGKVPSIKWPGFGNLFGGKVPSIKWPGFGNLFGGKVPGIKWPGFGSLFGGKVPAISWPGFGNLFGGKIPAISWPGFGNLFSGKVPGFKWPDFGSIFSWHLPAMHWPSIGDILAALTGGKVNKADGGILKAYALGGINKYFANGVENHIAQIAPPGTNRVWAEPETGGEAYIPLALSKRSRSLEIWNTVGKLLDAPQTAASSRPSSQSAVPASMIRPGIAPAMPRAIPSPIIPAPKVSSASSSGGNNLTTGDIIIHNPVPERASESLPRTIRKIAYATNRKHS